MKLYYRYGAMGSSKSMNLIMVAHNYRNQNKKVIIIKPKIDNRYSQDMVASRTGMKIKADILVEEKTELRNINVKDLSCILVDECQFLEPKHIDQLRELTLYVPVICYGLRSDYRTNLFPASRRLMELADSIEEIKTTCINCNSKAIINAKLKENKRIIKEGTKVVEVGGDELYQPMCWYCWYKT